MSVKPRDKPNSKRTPNTGGKCLETLAKSLHKPITKDGKSHNSAVVRNGKSTVPDTPKKGEKDSQKSKNVKDKSGLSKNVKASGEAGDSDDDAGSDTIGTGSSEEDEDSADILESLMDIVTDLGDLIETAAALHVVSRLKGSTIDLTKNSKCADCHKPLFLHMS